MSFTGQKLTPSTNLADTEHNMPRISASKGATTKTKSSGKAATGGRAKNATKARATGTRKKASS